MKVIRIKKSTIKKSVFLFIFAIVVTTLSTSFGMQSYYALNFTTGLVTGTNVNVRSGPGINYTIVTSVNKNEYVRVFAGIGEWYVVQVDNNYIGVINKKYIKAIYSNSSSSNNNTGTSSNNTGSSSNNTSTSGTNNTSTLTADELEVFNLINAQRSKNRSSSTKNRFTSTKFS